MRPKKEEQIDIYNNAINEFIKLLKSKSTDNISLRELAGIVGCSAPALYKYFSNKDELLLAVHNEGFKRMYNFKSNISSNSNLSGIEKLELGGKNYIDFALNNKKLYEIMFFNNGAINLIKNKGTEDYALKSIDILEKIITECKNEGYFDKLDEKDLAFSFWSTIHGAINLTLTNRFNNKYSQEKSLEKTIENIISLVKSTKK